MMRGDITSTPYYMLHPQFAFDSSFLQSLAGRQNRFSLAKTLADRNPSECEADSRPRIGCKDLRTMRTKYMSEAALSSSLHS